LGPHSKIWSTKTGQELHSLPHKHIVRAVHVDQVQRTAFSPARLRARTVAPCPTQRGRLQDGAWCATGGYEKQLRLFDLTNYHARTTKEGWWWWGASGLLWRGPQTNRGQPRTSAECVQDSCERTHSGHRGMCRPAPPRHVWRRASAAVRACSPRCHAGAAPILLTPCMCVCTRQGMGPADAGPSPRSGRLRARLVGRVFPCPQCADVCGWQRGHLP
jgi:hypothetical protein